MEQIGLHKCFGGTQYRYRHPAESLDCDMTFSIYLPRQPAAGDAVKWPVMYWLSGLTCTDENFVQKAGAQRMASRLGMIIVAPDTSPRGDGVPDDPDGSYDLGMGAGFYLNALNPPWDRNYRMYDYIVDELPALINSRFPVDADRQAISGHSMGGHGALTIALKNPRRFASVSAFAPIVSPPNCPWGIKALSNYLGDDEEAWRAYDACHLIRHSDARLPMLVDQGSSDQFLEEQLKPALLLEACAEVDFPITYNLRDGYDHSYFFIASFIDEHLKFHADALGISVAAES